MNVSVNHVIVAGKMLEMIQLQKMLNLHQMEEKVKQLQNQNQILRNQLRLQLRMAQKR